MSGSRTPDPPEGPGGLVVMIRTDPVTAARGVANLSSALRVFVLQQAKAG